MQAARGTSLTGDSTIPGPDRRPPSRARATRLFAVVAIAAYALDLGTKLLAVDRLTGRPDVPVVGDLLVLHLTRNPGAAFSTGTEYTVLLACVAVLAALVVLYLSRRVAGTGWAVALGLLLAGVTGNLTDRIFRSPGPFRGHVIDFLMVPHWPVFNVADMCINAAAGLILLQAFRGIRIDGHRATGDEPRQESRA
ncbi:MAG: peptidase signal peptidase [Nocardioides sp.]|nr:peptidase signal peptidase [Nocardioides sp.]